MTDENDDMTDDETLDENAVNDVQNALENTGAVDDGDDGEESEESDESPGLFGRIAEMSGTGESLDSYENDPIASVVDPTDGDDETHRGAKHIARGVDGLSPVTAAHPLIDIAVGFVLITADDRSDGGVFGGDETGANPDDGDGDINDERGDMLS